MQKHWARAWALRSGCRIALVATIGAGLPSLAAEPVVTSNDAAVPVNANVIRRLDGTTITVEHAATEIERLMKAARVKGLGVAILNDDQIVLERGFGERSTGNAFDARTVTYAASYTKTMFAYLVMMLVDEGKIDLDRPIASYFAKPITDIEKYADLKGDPRVERLTSRHLLSHTTGFANFRFLEPDEKLRFHFEPGTRYAYSGEGINLMQLVVETVTGRGLQELMKERIFDRFGMERTSMVWEKEFEANYADGHDDAGTSVGYKRRTGARAAGSAASDIHGMVLFARGAMRGEGLSEKARHAMFSPSIRIRSVRQFPTLDEATTTRDDAIELSYGIGVGVFKTPHGWAWFKEGNDNGFRNHMVVFPDKKTALVMMSNSNNAEGIFKELQATLIGDTYSPWEWDGYVPYEARK